MEKERKNNLDLTKNEAALSVNNLWVKRQKKEILKGINFSVEKGQILGIIGPSGCGKTTLLRSIVAVQKINEGEIVIFGQKAGSPKLRHEVAYTSQSLSIYNDISVYENVRYFAKLYQKNEEDILNAIQTVGLSQYTNHLVDSLSGGQAARTSLACALVAKPKLLILDEPTVGLDPITRNNLWDCFHKLAKDGMTLLVSSHVMDEASRCDSVLLIREGQVLAHDKIENLCVKTNTKSAEEAFIALVRKEQA